VQEHRAHPAATCLQAESSLVPAGQLCYHLILHNPGEAPELSTSMDTPRPRDPSAPLDYAPPAPRRRRNLFLLIPALLWFLTTVLGRPAVNFVSRIQDLSHQSRCLTYSPNPDMVVYTNDPTEKATLLAKGGGYTDQLPFLNLRPTKALIHWPSAWQQYTHGVQSSGVAFLHRLTSRSGNVRLVAIEVSPSFSGFNGTSNADTLAFSAQLYEPASITRDKHVILTKANHFLLNTFIEPGDHFRLLAGQPGPSDASRFTIGYTFNGAPGVIDGQLLDDDTVTLNPRGGVISQGTFWRLRPLPSVVTAVPFTGPAGPPVPATSPAEELPLAVANTVHIPYSKFVLLRRGEFTVALKVRADPKHADSLVYEWFDISAGVAPTTQASTDRPANGEGRLRASAFAAPLTAGPIFVMWSPSAPDSGWIYFHGDDPPLAVSAKAWDAIGDIKVSNDSAAWLTHP
jgi:hypothetical protein